MGLDHLMHYLSVVLGILKHFQYSNYVLHYSHHVRLSEYTNEWTKHIKQQPIIDMPTYYVAVTNHCFIMGKLTMYLPSSSPSLSEHVRLIAFPLAHYCVYTDFYCYYYLFLLIQNLSGFSLSTAGRKINDCQKISPSNLPQTGSNSECGILFLKHYAWMV